MQAKLYGIPNCSTVKKAMTWLEKRGVDVDFHNFKKEGLDEKRIKNWLEQVEWTRLVNRSGMTWRNLDEAQKAAVTSVSTATRLMSAQPSIVKRPVIEYGAKLLVGFDEEEYAKVFKK